MASPPFCDDAEFTFENVYVACPFCRHPNVFNRASDLPEQGFISGVEVKCLSAECKRPFRIGGDLVNPQHQLLLHDCDRLFREKRYTACVLYAAQSFEVFFSLYLRVELVFKPFGRQRETTQVRPPISEANDLLKALHRVMRRLSYVRLRSVFLHRVLANQGIESLAEAKHVIESLPSLSDTCPTNPVISRHSDKRIAALLLDLKKATVHELRNKVAHQELLRPSRQQALNAVKKAGDVLYPLGTHLQLFSADFNWYVFAGKKKAT